MNVSEYMNILRKMATIRISTLLFFFFSLEQSLSFLAHTCNPCPETRGMFPRRNKEGRKNQDRQAGIEN